VRSLEQELRETYSKFKGIAKEVKDLRSENEMLKAKADVTPFLKVGIDDCNKKHTAVL